MIGFDKSLKEMYFAVHRQTGDIFNSIGYGKNKVSYTKLGHLKSVFTTYHLDLDEYDIYKVEITSLMPVIVLVREGNK